MTPKPTHRSMFNTMVFKRLMMFTKLYKRCFILTIIIAILLSIMATIRPLILIEAIDLYIAPKEINGLLDMIILILILILLEVTLQFIFIYNANCIGQHIIKDLRVKLFSHIIYFKIDYFNKTPVGKLVTRIVNDLETISQFFSQGLFMIASNLLKMGLILLTMFYTNWQLTLIALSIMPIMLWCIQYFQKGIKKNYQEVRTQVANLNSFVQERIAGISIIQLFNRESIELNNFKEINHKHKSAHLRAIWNYSIFFPIVDALSSIVIGLLVWYGGLQSANYNIPPGQIIGFIMMTQMLYRPLRHIADKFNIIQMGLVAAERIFTILDTQGSTSRLGNVKANNIKGQINFNKVSFYYNPQEPVLQDITFNIKSGETLAIVGATGSGKSTISNLITRFYDVKKGEILIDFINIEDYNLKSLRQHIAIVLQDVFLFSDSILNNITVGNKNISLEQVINAAKKIGAHDFIMNLPKQYQYNVKERGMTLSTGQRQLIAFLRAYINNPKILILDEATSSIDNQSEQLITRALEKITKNRTSIIIAHRLTTILKADRILVIDKGKIVEQGTHQKLLQIPNGLYRNLYKKQFSEATTL